jgi:hypothetical protein
MSDELKPTQQAEIILQKKLNKLIMGMNERDKNLDHLIEYYGKPDTSIHTEQNETYIIKHGLENISLHMSDEDNEHPFFSIRILSTLDAVDAAQLTTDAGEYLGFYIASTIEGYHDSFFTDGSYGFTAEDVTFSDETEATLGAFLKLFASSGGMDDIS